MQASWAYVCVVLIWSTTPLAIKFSNHSLTPMASISLRIVFAVAVACMMFVLLRRRIPMRVENWPIYAAAAIGLFPNMPLVYTASEYIPSGLIAIMFGVTPFVNGLLAIPMLGEPKLSSSRWFSLLLALLGLWVVFSDQLTLGENGPLGIGLMIISVCVFCFSSLLVKRLSAVHEVEAVEQAMGGMVFSIPGLLLCWWLLDGDLNLELSAQSFWALLYLSLIGSLLGFVAYFKILKSFNIATVSLIPLLTPVIAVILGSYLAGETVSVNTLIGGACILLALGFYQGSFHFLWTQARRRLSRR